AVSLGDGKPPADLLRPAALTDPADRQREELRKKLNDRFAQSRKSAATDAYTESFDQAERVFRQSDVFDVTRENSKVADRYGRHHWSAAWSVALAGAGIKGGSVVGKTNATGTAVAEREVYSSHLFHTYMRAVGVDPTKNFYPNDRPVPIADPKAAAI